MGVDLSLVSGRGQLEDNERASLSGISIGIVCPNAFADQMERVLKYFPTLVPIVRSYDNEEQAPELANELTGSVEVLLFSGPVPYWRAKERIAFELPVHYVPLSGSGLYRALFLLDRRYRKQPLSYDTLPRQDVERVWREIGEPDWPVFGFDGRSNPSRRELVEFHRKLYDQGATKAALTGVRTVSEELTRLGIPNEWIVPTDLDIVVALERALLATATRRSKEPQIVVGLINIDKFDRLAVQQSSEHDVQRLKLDIHRLLLGYVESLDGHLTHLGGDEYLFVTTRGIFERETGGYKRIPLARDMEKAFGLSLSIGIGFGQTANQAGTHARLALRQSKEAGGNVAFIVREDKGLIGPLEMSDPWEADLSLISAERIKRAEQAGMTAVYLSKLIVDVSRRGKTRYVAQELASLLGVTVRTVHRLLTVWLDDKLVSIVGEERSLGKGRPKQVYELTFIAEIVRNL